MKKIAIITATRAEYGLLSPLIRRINEDDELELDLIVTGTHLSNKYGYTIDEIKKNGFPIAYEIPILEEDNTPYGISLTMANAIKGFGACFRYDRPEMVVILGDRTEMLGVASAAMNELIPIAHIHGGEVTEGAVDDCVRHALSKMSYLHFTSTEVYRKRVIQLGENPNRVFNVGALGTENILTQELYSEDEIRKEIRIPDEMKYVVVTYHPVTLDDGSACEQIDGLCKAINSLSDIFFVITSANADRGGEDINKHLKEFCDYHINSTFVWSLGMKRYLSAVKYAVCVLGNSSSGILEAPVLGTPTVNIGDRQKGRIMAETVVNCEVNQASIKNAIIDAIYMEHKASYIFGDGTTSQKILSIIKCFVNDHIDIKKMFYDIALTT